LPDGTGYGVSAADAHWLDATAPEARHGDGLSGASEPAGHMVVASFVRGPWEARGVLVITAGSAAETLSCGGWPVAGTLAPPTALRDLDGSGVATWDERPDASPLGGIARVLKLDLPVRLGVWQWIALSLGGDGLERCAATATATTVSIRWPDGHRTDAPLPARTEPS
jgi:hypothetical protein